MAKEEKLLSDAGKIEQEYKEGLAYKKQMGFLHSWAEYERFKAGDQWPAVTEKTKNLPRPVFNILEQIINHKVASVMNENIKMVFTANDAEEGSPAIEGADKYTRFADTTWEKVKQDQLNEEALDSGATTGPCIWHYYWDTSKQGGNQLKYIGEIGGEVIDPVNWFPGNPQEMNVQKQPYNIITSREQVEDVKALAIEKGLSHEIADLIKPDSETQDQAYDMAKKELTNDKKVTVITRYWRDKDGYIWFKKVASGIVIQPDTQMKVMDRGMKLYPLVVMQWKRRKKSAFGVSDVEGLIPNQKAINFLMAMQLLSVQLTGWPKLIVDTSLVHQKVTNTAGEVINVNSGQTGNVGNAIQYMNPGHVSNNAPNLVDSFLSYTKEVAGANENALGEQNSGQMNATAIMLLQKASGVPLESIKRRFYQAMEDVGLVWKEFFRVYYNTERMVSLKDDDGEEFSTTFTGSDYADVDMDLKIDIGPSSSYSESLMMTSLDKLFDGQHIPLEDYLQFAPKNVIPFKDRLLKKVQERQEQAMMQASDPAAIIAQLTPEEQQAFYSSPPEVQQQILSQLQPQAMAPQQIPMAQPPAPMPMGGA